MSSIYLAKLQSKHYPPPRDLPWRPTFSLAAFSSSPSPFYFNGASLASWAAPTKKSRYIHLYIIIYNFKHLKWRVRSLQSNIVAQVYIVYMGAASNGEISSASAHSDLLTSVLENRYRPIIGDCVIYYSYIRTPIMICVYLKFEIGWFLVIILQLS